MGLETENIRSPLHVMSPLDQDTHSTSSEEGDAGPTRSEEHSSQSPRPTLKRQDDTSSDPALREGLLDGTPSVQKRRRVTRACDECRRKKIKCDGKQPCTHCTVYSYRQSTL